jgi:hypothetical protein
MTTERSSSQEFGTKGWPWTLEVDAEVAPAARDVTVEKATRLSTLLARIPGVDQVDARPHGQCRFALVRLTVDAIDLSDASERACAYVHSCAAEAGMSPLTLVGVRCAR